MPVPADDATTDVVVERRGRSVRFAPFGGRIEAKLRRNQFYQGERLEYIEALGLPGTYVDVGAYVGTHALFFATYCPADVVHAFEPRARCFAHLDRNVQANGLADRVRAWKLGASDREETVPLTLERKTEEMHCKTLDQVVDTPVAVMKLDVEGMEPKVLAGAVGILARDKPLLF